MGGNLCCGGRSRDGGACHGGFFLGGHGDMGEHHGPGQGCRDWAALAEREARERVSWVNAKSTTGMASARGEVDDFARRIALLKGELAEVC
jgi:hypothetical protein